MRGAVATRTNMFGWLLAQYRRENGWTAEETLEIVTTFLDSGRLLSSEYTPLVELQLYLDERVAAQHASANGTRKILETREDVRGGVVRYLGDVARTVTADVANALRRLRVGDKLAAEGRLFERVS